MRFPYPIDCKSEDKRELLKEKLHITKGLVNSDNYSTVIKALDLLSNSILQQIKIQNLK